MGFPLILQNRTTISFVRSRRFPQVLFSSSNF